jgi:outer membrane protein assembly factor BamB
VSRPAPNVVIGAAALLASALAATAPARAVRGAEPEGVHWPSFRGPAASGISEGGPAPVRWSVERPEGILWRTKVPGLGHSSPVIWGERIFLTSAVGPAEEPSLKVGLYGDIAPVPDEGVHRFIVLCLDKATGRVLWERTAHTGAPQIKRHTKASHANSTPATDGKRLVAFFGSEGLHAYDLDGKPLWKKDLGRLDSGFFRFPGAQWGFGSSPAIHGDLVIVQCDVQGGGFIAAFRLDGGEEAWRTPRKDVPTWSTPTVHSAGERALVAVNGWKRIAGYEAATGKEVWWMEGGGDIPVPTPIVAHGLIFITSAHGGPSPVYAIRAAAEGQIAAGEAAAPGHLAWSVARGGAYMQTPIAYGDHLHVCRDNGALTVFEARTGRVLHEKRLGNGATGFTASAVACDGKLYYTAESGEVFVLRAGAEPEVLATNDLGEVAMATPAISQGRLYFRTRAHLIAVGEKRDAKPPEAGTPAKDR